MRRSRGGTQKVDGHGRVANEVGRVKPSRPWSVGEENDYFEKKNPTIEPQQLLESIGGMSEEETLKQLAIVFLMCELGGKKDRAPIESGIWVEGESESLDGLRTMKA